MRLILFACITTMIVSCSESGVKKVLVVANQDASINQSEKTIVAGNNGYESETLEYHTDDAVQINIQSSAGDKQLEITDNGFYVVNAKANDTIVGSYQSYVQAGETSQVMTQEKLKHDLDSLKMLIENKNVSAANRNFFIPPNSVVKITDNAEAQLVAPYHQLNIVQGKDPEVYRFFTISEVRETINRLEALTIAPEQ